MGYAPGTPNPMIGQRLGSYEVVAKLGEGGMGAVYRARDARLQRDVAIKVLPENFAADPDRLARFTREAQALAALNHPNIAQIYGVVDQPGLQGAALVMELVDGEDLSVVIARGPIPVAEALAIAAQIAAALEAAHDQGIVHRDLKPANIKLRADGTAKVLDFGLAKVADPAPGSNADAMLSPTFTSPAVTARGVILGTAAYMAPEQARGKPADARADIWAFGVILFEMLTGRRLFDGTEASDVIASVLRDGPNWDALPASTPASIRTLLRRCLQKDPKLRLRHAGDARLELTDADLSSIHVASGEVTSGLVASAVPGLSERERVEGRRKIRIASAIAVVATVLAAAALYYALARRANPMSDVPVRKWVVFQESGDKDIWSRENIPALSPDGTRLAYVDGAKLRIRDLSSLDTRDILPVGLPALPIWSPDGAAVMFTTDTQSLWRAPAAGGAPTKICDLPAGIVMGGVWRTDRSILVNVAYGPSAGEIFKVGETGGRPEKWPVPGLTDQHPVFYLRGLPDGSLVYATNTQAGALGRWLLQRGTGAPRQIQLPDNYGVTYAARGLVSPKRGEREGGHLLFARRDNTPGIFAVTFDLASGTLTGEPFRVAEAGIGPSASADGTLAYGLPNPGLRQLMWIDRDGTARGTIGQPQDSMWAPSISPDGTRIAVAATEGGRTSIWTHDVSRAVKTPVLTGVSVDPAWHPKDGSIVYQTGGWNLAAMPADGGKQQRMVAGPAPDYSPAWSRDGRYLLFGRFDAKGKSDIWMLEAGATEPKPVLSSPFSEEWPLPSPDGKHLAYVSNETGRYEVFVRPFPIVGEGKKQVSFAGGTSPRWNPRGGEIFYVEAGTLMAAPVKTTPSLVVESPKRLFALEDRDPTLRQYDTADGQHFVVVRTIRPARNGVAIVQNWLKEFDR